MMNEYRLKKYYPSLPSNWEGEENIVVVERDGEYCLHPSLYSVKLGNDLFKIPKREVESNGEYWSPIFFWELNDVLTTDLKVKVESVRFNDKLHTRNKNNVLYTPENFGGQITANDNHIFKNPKTYKVISIKRRSDDEVFSLGEEVILDNTIFKIKSFELLRCATGDGDGLKERVVMVFENGKYGVVESAKKVEEPLYKSYDGEDVNLGDTIYVIHELPLKIYKSKANEHVIPHLAFKSKSKAREYLEYNREMFSAKDFHEIWKEATTTHYILPPDFIKELKKEAERRNILYESRN